MKPAVSTARTTDFATAVRAGTLPASAPSLRRQRYNDHADTPSAAQNAATLPPSRAKRSSRACHCARNPCPPVSAFDFAIPSSTSVDRPAILATAFAPEYNAAGLPVTRRQGRTMPGLPRCTGQVKQAARSSSAIATLRRPFIRMTVRFAACGHAIGIQYRPVAIEVTDSGHSKTNHHIERQPTHGCRMHSSSFRLTGHYSARFTAPEPMLRDSVLFCAEPKKTRTALLRSE
jgi:hypothetical protein